MRLVGLIFVLVLLISRSALAQDNSAMLSGCNKLLGSSLEQPAESDWLVIIRELLADKILAPQDLQAILNGENPFKSRRDQEALVFKNPIYQLLSEMKTDSKLQMQLAELLKSRNSVLLDVKIQKKATEYPYRKMKFVEISGGNIRELYDAVPVDKTNEIINSFEVLDYPVTIHQYRQLVGQNSWDPSIIGDVKRGLSPTDLVNMSDEESFDGPMLFSSSEQINEFLGSLNTKDAKYSYRLLKPDELLWIIKNSNFGAEISLPFTIRRYVNGFYLEEPRIQISTNFLEYAASVVSNYGYFHSNRTILVNGHKIFLPLSRRPNCIQSNSIEASRSGPIMGLCVYRLITHTELSNWVYENHVPDYPKPTVQLVRELKSQGRGK